MTASVAFDKCFQRETTRLNQMVCTLKRGIELKRSVSWIMKSQNPNETSGRSSGTTLCHMRPQPDELAMSRCELGTPTRSRAARVVTARWYRTALGRPRLP